MRCRKSGQESVWMRTKDLILENRKSDEQRFGHSGRRRTRRWVRAPVQVVLCSPWMSPSRSFRPPCTLAPCSFQSSGVVDVRSSWIDCKSVICVCSQAAFVYSICNRDDSFCTGRSQAITAKSTGLFMPTARRDGGQESCSRPPNADITLPGLSRLRSPFVMMVRG